MTLNFLLQNLQLKDKKLIFTLKTPFDTVLQASKKCFDLLRNVGQKFVAPEER